MSTWQHWHRCSPKNAPLTRYRVDYYSQRCFYFFMWFIFALRAKMNHSLERQYLLPHAYISVTVAVYGAALQSAAWPLADSSGLYSARDSRAACQVSPLVTGPEMPGRIDSGRHSRSEARLDRHQGNPYSG